MKSDLNPAFMREAIALSEHAVTSEAGGPFGAVIVKDGQVVGRGWNQVTSGNDPTAHAEIVAIRNACSSLRTFSLSGCEIYSSCEPCPMCLAAIYWSRIVRIYFAATSEDAAAAGFDDRSFDDELRLPAERRSIPTKQALRDEACAAFEAWARKEDRTPY